MHPFYTTQSVRNRPLVHLLFAILACCLPQPATAKAEIVATSNEQANAECERRSPSIAAYSALRRQAPHLFASIGQGERGEITLLLEPRQLCDAQERMRTKYAKQFGPDEAWAASRAGVVLQDPYVLILREAVRFPNGQIGLYNRKVTRATLDGGVAGAYCLPVLPDGRVVLVKEYRHQERRWRLGIPGGFRDPGETAAQAARREAMEETGYAVQSLVKLGDVDAEGEAVPLFVAQVTGNSAPRDPDESEALGETIALSLAQLKEAVVAAGYRDAAGNCLALHGNLGSAVLMLETYLARPSAAH